MEFKFTEEQEALRSMMHSFAAQHWTESEVRALAATDSGFRTETWKLLGAELGIVGLLIPEELGGAGGGAIELAIVAEEMGAALAGVPYLSTAVLAVTALTHLSDDETARELLAAIGAGERIVALATTDPNGRWQLDTMSVQAQRAGDRWALNGEQGHVLDAVTADALLVLADVDGEDALFLVDQSAPGLTAEALSTLDQTRRLANLTFRETPAKLIGAVGSGCDAATKARDVGALVLAAEAVGASQRLLDLSVEYAKTRLQFGRPIGSFQAVKHRCADMYVAVEQARSTAYHAAWSRDERIDDVRLATDLATVVTAETYLSVAKNTVQVQGGIGFTWEHPVHLYYKRAVSDATLLGGRDVATERLAELAIDTAS